MGKARGSELIEQIRKQCLARGLNGIKGLCVLFRGLDKDYSKNISLEEFREGMRRYGIRMGNEEYSAVFADLDRDGSGSVDFQEFLDQLRPPMSKSRVSVINQAFDMLDAVKDGILKVEDLKVVYRSHAERHPRYQSGEWTLDQTLQSFLDTFDSPEDRDGLVTREEFLNYYAGVSATVSDDCYFDLMMRACWGLPPKGAK